MFVTIARKVLTAKIQFFLGLQTKKNFVHSKSTIYIKKGNNLSSINIFQFWKEKKIYNNISMAIQSQKKGKKRNNKCTKITPTDCYFLHQNG